MLSHLAPLKRSRTLSSSSSALSLFPSLSLCRKPPSHLQPFVSKKLNVGPRPQVTAALSASVFAVGVLDQAVQLWDESLGLQIGRLVGMNIEHYREGGGNQSQENVFSGPQLQFGETLYDKGNPVQTAHKAFTKEASCLAGFWINS